MPPSHQFAHDAHERTCNVAIEIKAKKGDILVAIETGKGLLKNGTEFLFTKGRTRVRAGGEVAERWPQFFAPADVEMDLEDTTRDPGRRRGE